MQQDLYNSHAVGTVLLLDPSDLETGPKHVTRTVLPFLGQVLWEHLMNIDSILTSAVR